MSAREREPFRVRSERVAEVERLIADLSERLAFVQSEIAVSERDLRRIMRGPRGPGLWRVLAGVLSLPLIVIAGMLLCALVGTLAGR